MITTTLRKLEEWSEAILHVLTYFCFRVERLDDFTDRCLFDKNFFEAVIYFVLFLISSVEIIIGRESSRADFFDSHQRPFSSAHFDSHQLLNCRKKRFFWEFPVINFRWRKRRATSRIRKYQTKQIIPQIILLGKNQRSPKKKSKSSWVRGWKGWRKSSGTAWRAMRRFFRA